MTKRYLEYQRSKRRRLAFDEVLLFWWWMFVIAVTGVTAIRIVITMASNGQLDRFKL